MNGQLWILLANSAQATIYQYNQKQKTIKPTHELLHPESRLKKQDIMSDEPGRHSKSNQSNEGRYEPASDPKKVEAGKFATEIADLLNHQIAHIDQLVIFAPHHFQSLLKHKLNKPTHQKTDSFIDKDYTKLQKLKLKHYLSQQLGIEIH